ncbi:class I adenylate-forming enzyme family protein [Elongatibacter sediminis]|uniref:Class I adenylate-forming enzyme family protein n=1 Tax=Elongatibacter sediminis TaxID=3119006 RepID=A0AAW9R6R9_9GAMM
MRTTEQARIDRLTAAGQWGTTTLHDLLREQALDRPDQLAVADPPNRAAFTEGDQLRLDFAELERAACALAADLLGRGIRPGDVLIAQLPNVVELVVSYFASSLVGAVLSPLPVQYGAHELGTAARVLRPAAVLTIDQVKGVPLAERAAKALPGVPVLRFAGAAESDGILTVTGQCGDAARKAVDAHLAAHPADANAILTVVWTSGTTGTPKGVPRSHNMWLATGRTSSEAAAYRTGDRLLNPFPLVNMAALGGFLFPMALNGCSLVLHQPFEAGLFLTQIQDERINFTIVPPAMLNHLARDTESWNRFDFSELRRIGSGSAPLSPWMVEVFDRDYGKPIVNFYGSNEGISLFSTPETSVEPDVRATMFPRLGCENMPWSGIAHDYVRNRVVALETGELITEPGQPGELQFAGPTVFDGYLGGNDDGVFTEDGWFRTGDLVEICGEPPNYYRIVGRCKDIINRAGMKISPTEIDILLEGFPGLTDGAVCGYPDRDYGERVCACVVPADPHHPPALEAINAFLLDQGLAKFKLPERIHYLEALPRNPLGKVQRHELELQVKTA